MKEIIKNNIIFKKILQPYINTFYDNQKQQIVNRNQIKNKILLLELQQNLEIKKIRNKNIYIDFYNKIFSLLQELNKELYLYNKNKNINSIIILKKNYYEKKKGKVKKKLNQMSKTKQYWIKYFYQKIKILCDKKRELDDKYFKELNKYDLEIENIRKNTKIEVIKFLELNKATIKKNFIQINNYEKKIQIYKDNKLERENIENLITILKDESIFLKTEEETEIKKIETKNAKLISNLLLKKNLKKDIYIEQIDLIHTKIIKYEKKINKFKIQISNYQKYYDNIHYKTLVTLNLMDDSVIILTNLQIQNLIKDYVKNITKEKNLYNYINSKFNAKMNILNRRIYYLNKYKINNLDNEILLLKKHKTEIKFILKKARLGLL